MTEETTTPAPRHDGFSPQRQRAFLEALAIEGYVDRACAMTGVSREAVYKHRQRRGGAAFALGWDAALLLARVHVADMLMMRAIEGQVDVTVRDADSGEWRRHRTDNRLALSLLGRLDRFSDDDHRAHADARMIAQDWDAFLDLIEAGHDGAGAALFLAARRVSGEGESPPPEPCQLCHGGADDAEPGDPAAAFWDEDADEAELDEAGMRNWLSVWRHRDSGKWVTNFPPPPGFAGYHSGEFGTDPDYARDLSDDEARIAAARSDSRVARERTIAERLHAEAFAVAA